MGKKSKAAGEPKRRNTKQREVILAILGRAGKPLHAQDILAQAQRRISAINKTTVYRTLERLREEGAVSALILEAGAVTYELAHAAHHHHHFLCLGCNKVFCLDGCAEGLRAMLPKDFVLEEHEIVLKGRCAECA